MINKEGWEITKFENCITPVKYTTKILSSSYLQNGIYPIISQDDKLISGYWNDFDAVFKVEKPVVIFGDHTRVVKYIDFDFVLGADGVKILLPKYFIDARFLFYYLKSIDLVSLGYSRHYKLLKELQIPIPPLPIQQQIVSELDTLTEIITKKKQQLAELDNLAKATFYDMFGDPVTNEKGWDKNMIGKLFNVSAGGTPKTNNEEYWVNGTIPWIGSNMCKNNVLYSNDGKFITELGLSKSSAKIFESNTILVALVGATIGKVSLLKFPTSTNQNIAGIDVNSNSEFCPEFVFYLTMNLYSLFMEIGDDKFKMANLSFVRNLPIIIPPLTLQTQFSDKINAIEKQKELIKKSINDTQLLFDYTMDKYFN
jgi:type I restriction enzyme S subunit